MSILICITCYNWYCNRDTTPGIHRSVAKVLQDDISAKRPAPWTSLNTGELQVWKEIENEEEMRIHFGPDPYLKRTYLEPFHKSLKDRTFWVDKIIIYHWADFKDNQNGDQLSYIVRQRLILTFFLFEGRVQSSFIHHAVRDSNDRRLIIEGKLSDRPFSRNKSYPDIDLDIKRYWQQWPLEARCGAVPHLLSESDWQELERRKRAGELPGCYDPYREFAPQH